MRRIFASRRRIVWATFTLLLLLDLGRSMYARVGYERPSEVWQPDPLVYADLSWPPGEDLPKETPLGQRIFMERCAVCHGPNGRGNGPAAPSLIPRPRDFSLGLFKYKSTPVGRAPSDADLIRVVTKGLRASAMPYWDDLLSSNETRAVVRFIKSLSPVFDQPGTIPIAIPPRVTPDAESLARGKELYVQQRCVACHGRDGRGSVTFRDSKGYPVVARDLTAPWTFRGGSAPEQIWLRLTTGLAPSPMPSFSDKTTPEERWDLTNHVLSLARVPPWETGGRLDGPGQKADLVRRGEYLVHAEMCGLCHTQINRTGIYRGDDSYLAGGMRIDAYPHGRFISRNLTSDPQTGLGSWSVEEIAQAIRNGRTPSRILNPLDMPWIFLHGFTMEDALAIGHYLKTLPPVRNKIPAPLRYGILETVVVKLAVLKPPAFASRVLVFVDGNFGQAPEERPRDLLQRMLVGGQWLVLIGGIASFLFAGASEHRFPRSKGGRKRKTVLIVGLFLTGFTLWAVYKLPAWGLIPPDQIANPVLASIPKPDLASLRSPEEVALVERGRYLYTVASCALCHNVDGSGGLKISWRPFGTLWTRNISSDPLTGIGRWKDKEIARAIRSGITPDGRSLHWQGMIWDHASNWDEEDLHALIAYLRTLPPIRREIPPSRPPAPEDCEKYTFWLTESTTPGCS